MIFNRRYKGLALLVGLGWLLMGPGCRAQNTPTPPAATPTTVAARHEDPPATTGPTSERQTVAPAGVWFSPEENPGLPDTSLDADTYAASAPEFPPDLEWLNTDRPLTLAELKGKVVILVFWAYDCIDCVYSFEGLQRLAQDYPDDLVIIGVHSLKLTAEAETEAVRRAIAGYELAYPVINDRDLRLWYNWGVQGTPTLIIIDPIGAIYGFHTGENVYGTFKPIVKLLTESYKK